MINKNVIEAKFLKPIGKSVFVKDLDSGEKKSQGGIILLDDNMKESGIHPRWAQVYAVGPDVDDLSPGEWVYVSHGRWTNGIDIEFPEGTEKLWRIEYPEAVLLVSANKPE